MALVRQSFAALAGSYGAVLGQAILTLVGNIYLARLLGPKAFGVLAAAILFYQPFRSLADLGLGPGMTQLARLGEIDIRRTLGRLILSNALLGGVWYAASPSLADLLGDRDLAAPLRLMSLGFFASPFLTVSSSILARDLRQRDIQISSSIGYLFGYLMISGAMGLAGIGHWSLIVGLLAQQVVTTTMQLRLSRAPIWPMWTPPPAELSRYGLHTMGSTIVSWVTMNVDSIVVQRAFGTQTLGAYSVAFNLVASPANMIAGTIAQVLFPASARIQGEAVRVARGFIATVEAISVATFAPFAMVAATSNTLISVLYGSKWVESGSVLPPLALSMGALGITYAASAVIRGAGHARREFAVQAGCATGMVVLIVALANVSTTAVAWGVFLSYATRAALMTYAASNLLGVAWGRVLRGLLTGGVMGVTAVTAISIISSFHGIEEASPIVRLGILLISAGFSSLFVGGVLASRTLSIEFRDAVTEILPVLPKAIRKWVSAVVAP
jgi:lipopolysaccharide exporter